jgi:ubiquitin carboxyl-terminal hydrolase 25/28
MWRKYNDGYVTEVKDTREIFDRDSETRPSTPYFLVYIKDQLKNSLVESVCRDIKGPSKDPQDAEMLDVGDNNSYNLIDLSTAEATNANLDAAVIESANSGWDSTDNRSISW